MNMKPHERARCAQTISLRTVLILAPALLLCACAVGPNFRRPSAPQPSAYVAPAKAGQPLAPEALRQHVLLGGRLDAHWWTLFHSDALDRLIAQALAGNHTLAAAQASLAQAQQLVAAQAGARYPQLQMDASVGRQSYGAQFLGSIQPPPPFTYYSLGPAVSYTLDYLGGISRSVEQRRALAEYQRQQLDATWLALTGHVVMQSLTAASTQAQIDAVEELLGEDRKDLQLVNAAFKAGAVSRVDVLTAQSQLATDETLLPPLRQQLTVARHALAVLAGKAPASWSPPRLALKQFTLPREVPVSLPSQLVHRRPDILAAEAQLHAATAAVGIATARLYPQITLSASLSEEALSVGGLFDASNSAWSLISGLTAPLFEGGRLRAEKRATLDALHASAERYQQTVVQAFGQVADLLAALRHDAQMLAAQSHAVSTAQNSLRLARRSYSAGNTGVLSVLDAQRLHQRSLLGFLRAESRRYLDTAQLLLATGGGLPDHPAPRSTVTAGAG